MALTAGVRLITRPVSFHLKAYRTFTCWAGCTDLSHAFPLPVCIGGVHALMHSCVLQLPHQRCAGMPPPVRTPSTGSSPDVRQSSGPLGNAPFQQQPPAGVRGPPQQNFSGPPGAGPLSRPPPGGASGPLGAPLGGGSGPLGRGMPSLGTPPGGGSGPLSFSGPPAGGSGPLGMPPPGARGPPGNMGGLPSMRPPGVHSLAFAS